jgi:hypothetical protein
MDSVRDHDGMFDRSEMNLSMRPVIERDRRRRHVSYFMV